MRKLIIRMIIITVLSMSSFSQDCDPNCYWGPYSNSIENHYCFGTSSYSPFTISDYSQIHMTFTEDGKILIYGSENDSTLCGYPNLDALLLVAGKLATEQISIVHSDTLYWTRYWPDYVFNEEYELQNLEELENGIEQDNHLSNMPTTEDIETEGLNLSDFHIEMLKKVEELTLYLIELKKRNLEIKKKIEELSFQSSMKGVQNEE